MHRHRFPAPKLKPGMTYRYFWDQEGCETALQADIAVDEAKARALDPYR